MSLSLIRKKMDLVRKSRFYVTVSPKFVAKK